MSDDIQCPYCGEDNEINHDDGYGLEEDTVYQQECRHCEKIFGYKTSISYYYKVSKVPCFNEGEHDLKDIHGYPKEFFIGKKRCKNCDEEIIVDKEANEKAMAEYFKSIGNI